MTDQTFTPNLDAVTMQFPTDRQHLLERLTLDKIEAVLGQIAHSTFSRTHVAESVYLTNHLSLIGLQELLQQLVNQVPQLDPQLNQRIQATITRCKKLSNYLAVALEYETDPQPTSEVYEEMSEAYWHHIPPAKTYDPELAAKMVELGYYESIEDALVEIEQSTREELERIREEVASQYTPATYWTTLPPQH